MAARTVNMCFQVPSTPHNQDYRFSCSGSVWQCAIMGFHLPPPRCQAEGPTWTICSGHKKIPPFPKESLTWKPTTDLVSNNSVMIEIPGYLFCIFVMDCWGRRPILSFCQVVINTLTRRRLFSVFLLQIISGVACIFCGLLQGQTDPDLKNLQVSFC